MKLGDLLKKEKADFVSIIKDGINITAVKGKSFNTDIEIQKKETYFVMKGGKLSEKKL
uniref:Uncharacterized protein n=1 Tax=viral metagenome TaxID=1070528 RepID=A0A6H1ZSG5_9ZZZZ